jgi:putative tricarboxylic transport membrane protein
MTRGWQVASLVFLALAAIVIYRSLEFPLTDSLGPGPGFFPFWLGMIGGGLAALLLVQVSAAGLEEDPGRRLVPDRAGAGRVGQVVVGLVGFAMLLTPLGFRLTALLFLGYLLIALGVRRWWLIALLSVAGSFGVFHAFYHWLRVPLPIGLLGI